MANKARDMTGLRVGSLTAIQREGSDEHGRALWMLRCDCGNTLVRKAANIMKAANDNAPSSCGCQHHLRSHGMSATHRNLQWVWSAMKQRCFNTSNKDYPNYGGRGISICIDWMTFSAFAKWADKSGYRRGLTIERVDVNGNYEPSNCTWIENPRQALNRRNTHLFEYKGESKDIRAWANEFGLPYYTLRTRLINYKWPIERALNEPVRFTK